MRTLVALALCLSLAPVTRAEDAAAATPAPAATCPDSVGDFLKTKGYSEIELSENTAKQFEVQAKLNGTIPLVLIVDTGASMSMFDRDTLEEAGLEFEKTDVRMAGVGGEQKVYSAQIANMEIGSAATGPISIMGTDLSDFRESMQKVGSRPADGLIGADFLARYSAIIEVKHSIMYLRTH